MRSCAPGASWAPSTPGAATPTLPRRSPSTRAPTPCSWGGARWRSSWAPPGRVRLLRARLHRLRQQRRAPVRSRGAALPAQGRHRDGPVHLPRGRGEQEPGDGDGALRVAGRAPGRAARRDRRGRRRSRRRPRGVRRGDVPARHTARAGADVAHGDGRFEHRRQDGGRPARSEEHGRRVPPPGDGAGGRVDAPNAAGAERCARGGPRPSSTDSPSRRRWSTPTRSTPNRSSRSTPS